MGLISAGLAFALQQVITALAAYFVILRGDTFGVEDRITLGGGPGRRGPTGVPEDDDHGDGLTTLGVRRGPRRVAQLPAYIGRLVTVSNGVIFSDPVSD